MHIHQADDNIRDVYSHSVKSLVDNAVSGYNTCLIVGGESGSGKSSVLLGENSERPGILTLIVEDLFRRIGTGWKHDFLNFLDSRTIEIYF